jgi:hypothetical protein
VSVSVRFVESLVERFPVLRPVYEEHIADMGEVLPHVFFGIGGGITDQVVGSYLRRDPDGLDWRAVLAFLDARLGRGEKEVDAVIGTDFLLSLPGPGHLGYGLIRELPPRLRLMFDGLRPQG